MKATNEAVRAINPTIQILQAAGISTVEDVERRYYLAQMALGDERHRSG